MRAKQGLRSNSESEAAQQLHVSEKVQPSPNSSWGRGIRPFIEGEGLAKVDKDKARPRLTNRVLQCSLEIERV